MEAFPPRLQHVYCDSITCAYRVTEEFRYQGGNINACVYGFTRRENDEAILIMVGSDRFRTDGVRYHVTLSTKPNVERASAGRKIESKQIIYVPWDHTQIKFTMAWQPLPLWKTKPSEIRDVAQAA